MIENELPEGFKKCSKCKEIKFLNEFHKDKSTKGGLRSSCKKCGKKYRDQDEKYSERYKTYTKNNKEKLSEKHKKYHTSNPHKIWTNSTYSQHKRRGCIFQFTRKELEDFAKTITHCPYCGIELVWGRKHDGKTVPSSPTLDRITNEKILTYNNVTICCHQCNTAKRQYPLKDYYQHCLNVVNHLASEFS